MLLFAILVLGTVLLGLVAIAVVDMRTLGISMKQAIWLSPLKAIFRFDNSDLANANHIDGPIIYAISEQSRLDPALYLASLPSETLHVLDPASANFWPTNWFRELARTVVFDKEKMIANRRLLRQLKGNGRIAVYFPAGVEPDQKTFRLYRAVTLLARKSGARIIPIYTEGARFLPSSFTPAAKAPRQRFAPLKAHALPAMDMAAIIEKRGRDFSSPSNALFDRMAQSRLEATDFSVGMFKAMLNAARTYGPGRIIVEDTVTGSLTYKRVMIGARVLGKRFAEMSKPGEAMGVLLPNANGAIVTFFALQSAGRVAAMLNYTAGPSNVVSAVNTACINTVLSSKAFIEKADLQDVVQALEANGTKIVWLDELRETITTLEKISAAVLWKRPLVQVKAEDPAVILYTSGSEGSPKGVVLSHRNLHVNAAQSEARVDISVEDCLFNVLPVFHSFGLTGGTILPLFYGVRLFLYPSPLHYKLIPTVAAKVKPTIMFGTDTFLNGYARTAKDSDFNSLRFVVAGAEAVKPDTARTYMERFGCWILEGFGMTEASPVVAVNTTTHNKRGTVGRILPGIEVRLEPVEGIDDGGRLWVRGPNVMLGYMKADRPGVLQPIGDSWHDSGDIVHIDKNGYMAIRGRAKRFAKIAGEMVSLGAVEMLVKAHWPEADHAAVSIPDRRKGERIVLATTTPEPDKKSLVEFSKKKGMTELMVPQDFLKVEEVPVLGSGKTDYVMTKKLVEEQMVEGSKRNAA